MKFGVGFRAGFVSGACAHVPADGPVAARGWGRDFGCSFERAAGAGGFVRGSSRGTAPPAL